MMRLIVRVNFDYHNFFANKYVAKYLTTIIYKIVPSDKNIGYSSSFVAKDNEIIERSEQMNKPIRQFSIEIKHKSDNYIISNCIYFYASKNIFLLFLIGNRFSAILK